MAVRLYEWNADVSGAFMGVTHHVEVVLRNIIDRALTSAFPADPDVWYLNPEVLSPQGLEKVREAIQRIRGEGKPATHGRVVAALNYGFWDALFAKRYNELWQTCLRDAFPRGPRRRRDVAAVTGQIRNFRNRLAHHERIIHQDLAEHHADLLRIPAWVDPQVRNWVARQSRVPDLLVARPA